MKIVKAGESHGEAIVGICFGQKRAPKNGAR